ncbi:PPC domain-containing protein [Massilia sp. H-1]|nr:PPC domain-containing protein [Massilia sp. H-1]
MRVFTNGGSGDVDLYMALNRYPTTTGYTIASLTAGNNESVKLSYPATGYWYYIMLKAKTPFSGVTISATWD